MMFRNRIDMGLGAVRKWLRPLRGQLPRRRRRLWRYVSPQRRGAGLFALALLVTCVYGYWSLTNDWQIRKQAEGYLRDLTGGDVKIGRGSFRLFGGVVLEDVRLYIPDEVSKQPFFRAKTVLLRHSPLSLLVQRRLQPTEVICIEPTVTLEMDPNTKTTNIEAMLALARGRRGSGAGGGTVLPPIRVRQGRLRVVDKDNPQMEYEEYSRSLTVFMAPSEEDRDTYRVKFEGVESVRKGALSFNVATGDVSGIEGDVPNIESITFALPPKYKRWLEDYGITGGFTIVGGKGGESSFQLMLNDLSLKLPVEVGGLTVTGLTGKLTLEPNGVELEGIRGRIAPAGDPNVEGDPNHRNFEISGRYLGYGTNSPFEVIITIENSFLPQVDPNSPLAGALAKVRERLAPDGRFDLGVSLARSDDGEVRLKNGTITPRGMSATLKYFRYRLDDLAGVIAFDPDTISFGPNGPDGAGLSARHGDARISIGGELRDIGELWVGQILIQAKDVSFDADLRGALPRRFGRAWDQIVPGGAGSLDIIVTLDGQRAKPDIEITVTSDHKASFNYVKFPYPVTNVGGTVHIKGNKAVITDLNGTNKATGARCRVNGEVTGILGGGLDVKVIVAVEQMLLDDVLLAALPNRESEALASLNASGQAENVYAVVNWSRADGLDYNAEVSLKDARFNHDIFPYAIDNAAGTITIQPGVVTIGMIAGRHKNSHVLISGEVIRQPVDLGFDLTVWGKEIILDEELFDALPTKVQKVWRMLSPSGAADMELSFQRNTPDQPGSLGYRLLLVARDMQVRCEKFPYPIRGISGRIIATPGRIELDNLAADDGLMHAKVSGTMIYDPNGDSTQLTIDANGVPIDEQLLAAVPGEFAPLARRFRTGGTCSFKLKNVRFSRVPLVDGKTTATRPGESPSLITWRVGDPNSDDSYVSVKGAIMDLGFGVKTISGKFTGLAARTQQGLSLDAKMHLDRILVGGKAVTDLRGRFGKHPSNSLIRIEDLSGFIHGGRLAGRAEFRLSQPLKYGMYLTVERVRLEDLLKPSGDGGDGGDSEKGSKMKGLLLGNIQLIGTAGRPEDRRARGRLKITKGKLSKVPVMLGLLYVVPLVLPGDSEFTDGDVTYHLKGEALTFEEIYMTGPSLSLIGSGTMNTKTEALKLTFVTGPPGKLPPIAKLVGAEGLLVPLAHELVEIRVTGTLSNPKYETVALGSVHDLIRRLITPGGED